MTSSMSRMSVTLRGLSESFLPPVGALLLIGAATLWVDRVAKEFGERPLVISVEAADAEWDPELLTDDGMAENAEGPASDPAATSPELTEARALSRAGDHARALALIETLSEARKADPAVWNELGVYRLRAGQAGQAVLAFDQALVLVPRYSRAIYNRALARSAAGDRAAARADYQAALALEPGYHEARYNYGLLLLDSGDTAGAIRELRAAVGLAGNDAKAKTWFSLGVAETRAGHRKRAFDAYENAIEFRPTYLLPRYNQAALLMGEASADTLDRATGIVAQLMALAPDFAPGWFLKGRLASRQGDERSALTAYERAARLDRRFWKAHYNWGLVALGLEELALAETLFTRLASEFPKRAEPHFNLGRIDYKRGRFAEAARRYEKATDVAGGSYPEAQTNLALALDAAGKYEEALAALQKVTPSERDRGPLLVNRSLIEKHLGQLDAARASLEQAIAASPGYATAYYNLGKLESDAARKDPTHHELAAKAFAKALELDPKNAKASVNLGVELGALGRWEEAISAYRSALAVHPDQRAALFNLGIALKESGKLEEAAEVYRTLIRGDEENIKAHQNLAVVYGRLGQADLAIQTIRTALDRDAGNVSLRFNLAVQLRKSGRVDDARAELERVVALSPAHAKAAVLLARAYLDLGRHADAEAVLEPATRSKRPKVDVFSVLAETRLAAGDLPGARKAVARAFELSPKSPIVAALTERIAKHQESQ